MKTLYPLFFKKIKP